jgi:CheY-like chemotaxis protein
VNSGRKQPCWREAGAAFATSDAAPTHTRQASDKLPEINKLLLRPSWPATYGTQDIAHVPQPGGRSSQVNRGFLRGMDPESSAVQKGGFTEMDMNRIAATPVQKVVVVNGNTDVLGMLETVLDAGRYDMVFVESSEHAYSQIKKVIPNLVILCARIEQLEGFQLLTMLKLDPDTRDIPVLTYTTECEGQDFDAAFAQLADDDEEIFPAARPALRMN